MIHKIIASNKIGALLLFPVALLICQLPFLFQSDLAVVDGISMFSGFFQSLGENYVGLLKAMRIIVLLISGFVLHQLVVRLDIQRDRGHHALYWFCFLNSFFLGPELDLSIPLANLFLILSLNRTLSVYRDKKSYSIAFDSGFFIGCAVLFNPFYIILVLFTLIGLTSLKTLNYREVLLVIIGMITPLLITAFVIYFFDLAYLDFFKKLVFINDDLAKLDIADMAQLKPLNVFGNLLTIVILVYSVIKLIQIANKENTRRSKLIQLLFILTIAVGLIRLLSRMYDLNVPSIVILSVPFSMMMIHFFTGKKRHWIPISLFYLWFIISATNCILEVV